MLSAFKSVLLRLLPEGKVLLAVSGGIDSMCMASLFFEAGMKFSVAHCNFHLRGEESDGDEQMVRDWCRERNVGFHKTDFDTVSFARERGLSIEMAARELRYSWFASLCSEFGYTHLAVAHNANDNAETLFLNIIRGTGIDGLAGMRPVSQIPCFGGKDGGNTGTGREDARSVLLVRPMLGFTRKQIEGYVFSNGVPYRNDSTNAETEYRRNRIRHLVFPEMERMNPSFIKTVNREMTHFSRAAALLKSYCASAIERAADGNPYMLDIRKLMSCPHWEYVLYEYMAGFGFNSSAVASVEHLLEGQSTLSGKMFRSQEYELLTSAGRLIVRKRKSKAADAVGSLEVRCDGTYQFGGTRFVTETLPRESVSCLKQPEGILLFDADVLKYPFLCRRWEAGDWFRPLGSRGRKKVSDFFSDMKYDRFSKEDAVMIVDESLADASEKHISSILGKRIDDMYKVTDRTVSVLKISVI